MKRVLTGIGCLALLTFLYAPTDAASKSVLAKNGTCAVFDGDGGIASGGDSVVIMNPSGNAMVKCSVKGVPNSSRRTVHFDHENTGAMCGTAAGMTDDWHETISAYGNATLTCRMRHE
jgi:hypothetical protein